MTNTERIQAHNAELREAIEMAESLPDAGEGGEDVSEETVEYTAKLETLENAITDLEVALRHKESVQPVTESLTATENGTYRPSEGVDGYSVVNVDVPIPDDYIKPSGTLEVTENGTYDVTEYTSVNVSVEASGGNDVAGGIIDKTITEFYSDKCAKIGEYSFRACKNLKTLVAPNAECVEAYALIIVPL